MHLVESRDGEDERRARRGPDMRLATSLGQGEGPARWQDPGRGSRARRFDARRPLPWSPACFWNRAEHALGRRCSMLECTIPAFARPRIVDGGTQWMVLSAAVNNPRSSVRVDGTLQHASACVQRRRAGFCRRRLIAGAPQRATRLAVSQGFHNHRGRPRGLQSWPGVAALGLRGGLAEGERAF